MSNKLLFTVLSTLHHVLSVESNILPRQETDTWNPAVTARDNIGDLFGCANSAISIISAAPVIPSELNEFINEFIITADVTDPTAVCDAPQIPSSLSDEYSSFLNECVTWYSSESANIDEFTSDCVDNKLYASITSLVDNMQSFVSEECTSTLATTTTDSTVTTTIENSSVLDTSTTWVDSQTPTQTETKTTTDVIESNTYSSTSTTTITSTTSTTSSSTEDTAAGVRPSPVIVLVVAGVLGHLILGDFEV